MKTFPCGLCHGEAFTFLYAQRDVYGQAIRVVACNFCGLSQLNPRRDEEEEVVFYASHFHDLHALHRKKQRSQRWLTRKNRIAAGILDGLAEQRPLEGARLLDVGCGHGFLLRQARERGAKVSGVEPDRTAAEALRAEGFEVFIGSLLDFAHQAPDLFDIVTLSHVVEHANEPISLLRTGAGLLRPAGLLAAEVPNVTWQLSEGRHPRSAHSAHLYYHSERTLSALFEVSGLRVQAVSFGLGERMVRIIGMPGSPRDLAGLALDDAEEVRVATERAVRRLRRQWYRLFYRSAKRSVQRAMGRE